MACIDCNFYFPNLYVLFAVCAVRGLAILKLIVKYQRISEPGNAYVLKNLLPHREKKPQ